ncbi:hypothetical protein PENTCL1PPCAC_16880, partial [Pristionchus entomophagus]
GFALNAYLLVSLFRLARMSRNIYLYPLFVSCIEGLFLCLSVGVMDFVNTFRDGNMICVLMGPLVPYFCGICVNSLNVDIDSSDFDLTISQFIQNLFEIGVNETIQVFGVGSRNMTLNVNYSVLFLFNSSSLIGGLQGDKDILTTLILYGFIPYPCSYSIIIVMMTLTWKRLSSHGAKQSCRTIKMQRQFFMMQILQSVLPLAILVPPFIMVIYGLCKGADLGLATLPGS